MEPLSAALATVVVQEIFRGAWKSAAQPPDWIKNKLAATDPFGIEAAEYAKHVIAQYNSMRIIGMDQPVPLDGIYINVNVRDQKSRYRDFESDYWEWRAAEGLVDYSERALPAVQAVDGLNKLLVLGRPGAGKTTFLKYLAIASLRKQLKTNLLPIFASLKEWSRTPGTKLETLLIRQFEVCNLAQPKEFVRKLLRDGRCLVLLDGFDEIAPEERSKGISQVEAVVQQFPRSHFVLSCRTAANTYVFGGFHEVEIADFDDIQIEKFIHKWFEAPIANKCLEELQSSASRGLWDLARNPLLLTLICIAYGESHSFPESRVSLYETALDALLKKWDASRNVIRFNPYRQLVPHKKELLFSRIAASGFEKGTDIYLLRDLGGVVQRFMEDLAPGKAYDTEDLLDAIEAQHGILVSIESGEYRFSHLTFQEFYTARFIVDSTDSALATKVLKAHLGESRWNEVFLIIGGLHKDASGYVYQVKLALDRLRDHHVGRVLELAQANIQNPSAFDHSLNVILALAQLLQDVTNQGAGRGLEATSELATLTAQRVCELTGIGVSPVAAMVRVTQLGMAKNRAVLREAAAAVTEDPASWDSLRRFFLGMHVLIGCLAGEAVVPASYRAVILGVLFSQGCPPPPVSEGETLFLT